MRTLCDTLDHWMIDRRVSGCAKAATAERRMYGDPRLLLDREPPRHR
jgi:hypothetical protein